MEIYRRVNELNSDLHAYSVEQIANNATVDIGDIIIVGITHPSGYGNSGIELSGARQIGSDYSATTAQWSIDSTLTIKIFISTSTNINVTSLPDGAYTMIRLFT